MNAGTVACPPHLGPTAAPRRPLPFRVRRAVWHHTGILGAVRHCQAVYRFLTVRMRIDSRSIRLYSVLSARHKNPDDRGGREWRREARPSAHTALRGLGPRLAVPKSPRQLWGS